MAQSVAASQTLKGVALFEKDVNGDVLSWCFPSVDKTIEGVLKSRSGLLEASNASSTPSSTLSPTILSSITEAPFRFSRFGQSWLYQLSAAVDATVSKAKKVLAINVAVISNVYNPTKYHELAKLFLKAYESELSPIPVMQLYLEILTTNKTAGGKFGSFDDGAANFDPRRAMISPLKFLISTLGQESILVWVAMLLKKRVMVYHPKLNEVQNLVKIFPLLGAWHRQDFSMLRPYVNLDNDVEVEELRRAGVYVAGVVDPSAVSRKDLYDLFIDMPSKTFSFSLGKEKDASGGAGSTGGDERPADFHLTKFHRTTLDTFLTAAQNENDQGVIKVVAQQTKEFLDKIVALKAEDPSGAITREGLAAAGLPAAMQNWIFSVASAEGMTKK